MRPEFKALRSEFPLPPWSFSACLSGNRTGGQKFSSRLRSKIGFPLEAGRLAGWLAFSGPATGKGGFAVVALFLSTLIPTLAQSQNPVGFKIDRYKRLWERNPFTLVTPAVAHAQASAFDKLVLLSWMKEGTRDVVYIQNTENNQVERISAKPNSNNFKLIQLRLNSNTNAKSDVTTIDPKLVEAVISNGAEQGSVHFKMEAPDTAGTAANTAAATPPVAMAPPNNSPYRNVPVRGPVPGASPGFARGVPTNQRPPPGYNARMQRAAEIRRKRMLPPPSNPQPINPHQ